MVVFPLNNIELWDGDCLELMNNIQDKKGVRNGQ